MSDETSQEQESARGTPEKPRRYALAELRGIVKPLPGRESMEFDDILDEAMQEWADREVRIVNGEDPDSD
jgi:hypothetical protein